MKSKRLFAYLYARNFFYLRLQCHKRFVLRGVGDSKTPLIFVSIACLVNVVLDLYFIRVLRMDAAGAALATVISQGFSMLLAVLHLYRKKFV